MLQTEPGQVTCTDRYGVSALRHPTYTEVVSGVEEYTQEAADALASGQLAGNPELAHIVLGTVHIEWLRQW